jgi:4-oxalocrotonate tautomerase
MPIIQITMIVGRTDDQKRAMYEAVTEAVHTTLGAPKENVRIMINEVPPLHFATAGVVKSGPSS